MTNKINLIYVMNCTSFHFTAIEPEGEFLFSGSALEQPPWERCRVVAEEMPLGTERSRALRVTLVKFHMEKSSSCTLLHGATRAFSD